MIDIVERLRATDDIRPDDGYVADLLEEAADEIERLRDRATAAEARVRELNMLSVGLKATISQLNVIVKAAEAREAKCASAMRAVHADLIEAVREGRWQTVADAVETLRAALAAPPEPRERYDEKRSPPRSK